MIDRFNIRVYAILIQNGKLLLSTEQYLGKTLVKFPGGGVEYGEGIREALIREFREEVDRTVEIGELFYVTDYFIQSAFIESDQIISFYYLVPTDGEIEDSMTEHQLSWVELTPDNEASLTFPQDREVFKKLYSGGSATQ